MPSPAVNRALTLARVELSPRHRMPHPAAVVAGTVLSVGLCLLADASLVKAGTALFPATRGYVHFQFADYAKLTVIGVVVAGLAWPVVVRLTSEPRWVFARLAVLVTAVLLLPDLYIWLTGQPGRAVLVLVAMHLAIGLITYNVLVRVAPARPAA
ncbi:MAG TPA: DUF6069 family protein [Streptosporangiaceae bacterium]|jgi:hypothetical protein